MSNNTTQQVPHDDRRRQPRIQPPGLLVVTRFGDMRRITNALVINISEGGAALRIAEAIAVGERLSFTVAPNQPPVHCEVLECTRVDDNNYELRCKCILGGFEMQKSG